ncbi:MAG: hypothetical protein PVF45_08540 [Anaerolineae bacterium]|jgi:hypothetical protein
MNAVLPVLVTTRAGEFEYFRRWWDEGHRFGLMTVPHKKVRQSSKRSPAKAGRGPAVSANLAALHADFPGPRYLDNGIFARLGMTTRELLAYAEGVNCNYLFAPDVFADPAATLERAEEAMCEWKRSYYPFHLVGVAQGRGGEYWDVEDPDEALACSVEDYVACARALVGLGYEHIAVGGLLRLRGDSERSRKVGAGPLRRIDEGLMWAVLARIGAEIAPPWLHVLGALHQDRLSRFTLLGVTSADSKQWARAYTRYRDFKGTTAAYRRKLRERFVREQYFQRQMRLPGLEPVGHYRAKNA